MLIKVYMYMYDVLMMCVKIVLHLSYNLSLILPENVPIKFYPTKYSVMIYFK